MPTEHGTKPETPDRTIPMQFVNLLIKLGVKFEPLKWRESPEWKIFVAGYNCAAEEISAQIKKLN